MPRTIEPLESRSIRDKRDALLAAELTIARDAGYRFLPLHDLTDRYRRGSEHVGHVEFWRDLDGHLSAAVEHAEHASAVGRELVRYWQRLAEIERATGALFEASLLHRLVLEAVTTSARVPVNDRLMTRRELRADGWISVTPVHAVEGSATGTRARARSEDTLIVGGTAMTLRATMPAAEADKRTRRELNIRRSENYVAQCASVVRKLTAQYRAAGETNMTKEQVQAEIAALLRERAHYVEYNMPERAAQVDAQLELLALISDG